MCTACLVQASFIALKMSDWLWGSWHSIQCAGLYPAMETLSPLPSVLRTSLQVQGREVINKIQRIFFKLITWEISHCSGAYNSSLMWAWSSFCSTYHQNTGSFKASSHPVGLVGRGFLGILCGQTCVVAAACMGMETGGEVVGKGSRSVREWGSFWESRARHALRDLGGLDNHWLSDWRNHLLRFAGLRAEGPNVKSLNKQDHSKK